MKNSDTFQEEKHRTKDVFALREDGSAYVLLLQPHESLEEIYALFHDPENLELIINYDLPVICLKSQKDIVIEQMNVLLGIAREDVSFGDSQPTNYVQ